MGLLLCCPAIFRRDFSEGDDKERVADYRAVNSGTLTVELVHPDGSVDKGSGGVSETPGIFRVLIRAGKPGKPRLRLTLNSKGKTSVHELGPVEVYASCQLAEKANPEPPISAMLWCVTIQPLSGTAPRWTA